MAFSAAFTQSTFLYNTSTLSHTTTWKKDPLILRFPYVTKAAAETPPKSKENIATATKPPEKDTTTTTAQPTTTTPARPKKPVYSMKKGQIVRVDKDKYLNSVNYLSVGHPTYFKGLDYIYENRGEVLDLRIFETGEYALIAWVGIPTAPAWLPTDMLIKCAHAYASCRNPQDV
ncbi:oxidoreductase [Lithospermum erythrorhizon]|uniref:Oxidoreductase n=1 Tax=Lithospermum erythrorhizon TaxID=34254 RepID=A0AAV3NTL7_LITER